MELLADEEADDQRIPEDGELEGSGDATHLFLVSLKFITCRVASRRVIIFLR